MSAISIATVLPGIHGAYGAPATKGPTFTAEQASQGRRTYAREYASCHGQNLSGSEFASRLQALNLETHQVLWIARQRAPIATCSLATAGGVVFAGYMDRHFQAFGARSGSRLWDIRLNDMPSGCPISYSLDGRQ